MARRTSIGQTGPATAPEPTIAMKHSSTVALFTFLAACGGAPSGPTAPEPDELGLPDQDEPVEGDGAPESVDTGIACAKAEATCEGGVCTVAMNNTCEAPVTCELRIIALCQGETEVGEARGVGRDTFPVGYEGKLQAGADCEGRAVVGTQVDTLECK